MHSILRRSRLLTILLFAIFQVNAQTRTSVNTGNFNVPGTWDCTCVPSTSDNIVIASGDTVFLVANTLIGNVEIQNGAQLNNNGRRLSVNGNYTVNGEHTGNGVIYFLGINTTIDGVGEISTGSNVDIRNTGISIASTAFLVKSGGGSVRIRGARTLTNYGYFATTRNITGNTASSTFYNATGATLVAGRTLMNTGVLNAADSGNTVVYNRNANQTIKTPFNSQYYNLTIDGSGNKSLASNLIVLNDLQLNGGILRVSGNDVDIKGNYINVGGSLNEGSGEIQFSGPNNQSIQAIQTERFQDLRINKSGGILTLQQDIELDGILFMDAGTIDARSSTLSLGINASNIGSLNYTGGQVMGTLSRWMNTGTTVYTFPLGDGTNYLPGQLSFTTISNGKMNGRYIPSFPGSNGLPLLDTPDSIFSTFSEGYWRFTDTSGLTGSEFNLQLTANGFASYAIDPSTRLVFRNDPSSNWQIVGSHSSATSPNVFRNAVNVLPIEVTLGDTTRCLLPSPTTSAISGLSTVCKNTSAVAYSVTNTPGSTYLWTINGGAQSSGGSSNSITVNWGNVGKTGSVQVIEYSGCEYGNPVALNVNIQAIDPDQIIGQTVGYEGMTNNVYYVAEQAGYTYNWTVSGVASRSGSGSNDTIYVDFNSTGQALIELYLSNGCGNSDTISTTVTVQPTIKSISTGNWTSTSSWDCSCNPGNNSTVRIKQGHTITSTTNNERVGTIIIDSSGSLIVTGTRIQVNDMVNNEGNIQGSGEVRMRTSGSFIVGSGSWTGHSGNLTFQAGTHTISNEVSMMRTGNIQLNNNAVVFNNGYLETTGTMSGNNSSSWEQKENSTLDIYNINWTNGTFLASSSGNKVIYSGTGAFTRNVKYAVLGQYYDLHFEGNNVSGIYRIINGNLAIINDLNLKGGTLDANNSNFAIDISGNWNNAGGTFNPRSALVTFNGVDQSINHSTRESFYNLTVASTGTLSANCAITAGNNLVINSRSILDMNNANDYQLNIQGDVANDGQINFYQNEFLLDGVTLQNLSGDMNCYDITIDNTGGIEIDTGTINLSHNLVIDAGQFNTKGNMVFLSDASETAKITDLTGGGSIIGNVKVQRYLNEGNGWYLLGSPVTGTDLEDWNTEIYMSGFAGADGPASGFVSVQSYDESARGIGGALSAGFQDPTNTTNYITPGDGWMVYYQYVKPGILANTIDANGPLYTGTYNTGSLSYTNSGASGDNGWHIVGNPYASPVDFSLLTLSGINNGTGFVKRANSGNYWDIVNDNIDYLYSHEAMWVQVNSGGGSVIFNENDKADVTDDYNARKSSISQFGHPLKMILTSKQFKGYDDYSVLRFGGDSNSVNYDSVFGESRKLGNSYGYHPNISSFSLADSSDVYYNNLNPADNNMTIPLRIWTRFSFSVLRDYTIVFEGIEEWYANNHCLFLVDSATNNSVKIDTGFSSYSWQMIDTISTPRLYLHHYSPIAASKSDISCYNEKDGKLSASGSNSISGFHNYTWYNSNGLVVKSDSNFSGISTLSNLDAGTYRVEVSDNGACGTISQTFELLNPEPIIADFDAPSVVDLYGDSIHFENKSLNGNTYHWDFDDKSTSTIISPSYKFKEVGEYKITLTTYQNKNCYKTKEKSIIVEDYTGIEISKANDGLNVYSFENQLVISTKFETYKNLKISVYNSMGQGILFREYRDIKRLNERIQFTNSKGIFFVRVESNSDVKTFKILLD